MIVFLVLSLFFALVLLFWQISLLISVIFGAPSVHASDDAIYKAFELANLKGGETVLDLGCADAGALICAAKKFGAKGIGVEISPFNFLKAKLNIALSKQAGQIKIIFGNLKRRSELIKQSDVIYLYLFPKLLDEIERKVFDQSKHNARIVSVGFYFKNHKAKLQQTAINHGLPTNIYLYEKTDKYFRRSSRA